MSELVLALMAWLSAQMGLEMPPAPRVVLVPPAQIDPRGNFRALHDGRTHTVYLRDDWNADDLRSRATLLHELVHHMQAVHHVKSNCAGAAEEQAYELTAAWLREQGVADPQALMNIDDFTLAVLSLCTDPG